MIATLTAQETVTAEVLVGPVADEIRRMAAEAEASRRLPDQLVAHLESRASSRSTSPKEFGGLDLPLPEALRVVEEVSRHDGSTGWTVALGVANSLFTCALPDAAAARVLGDGSPLIAAAPAFGVRAERVDRGYRLTGRWPFNSGAPNAGWISAATPIFDGDVPRMGETGPEMVLTFLSPSDVQIIDTWYVTGLRATAPRTCTWTTSSCPTR